MKNIFLSLLFLVLLLPSQAVWADTVTRPQPAAVPMRQIAPVAPSASKALAVSGRNLELGAPVILSVTPLEVSMQNAVITVRGQNFGANREGGRKVILTQVNGGMQVLPTIASWKNNRITFKAPDLSGPYLLQVDNRSAKPLSEGKEIMLGVRQKDIRVDFAPVFDGTRLDNNNISYFYLGPAGGAPLRWRAIYATELPGFPRLLDGGDKRTVVSKAWNNKKNTLYDVSIRCYLRLHSNPVLPTFDSNNHLVFSIPYSAEIYQNATVFWYNTQDADPYGLKKHLLNEPMQGILTIRVPLSVEKVAGKSKILSGRADVTFNGELVIKNPWPDKGLESQLQRDWTAAKALFASAIEAKFAKSDYSMSIFGQEFTGLIQNLVGPNATILRIQTTGSHTLKVHYLE